MLLSRLLSCALLATLSQLSDASTQSVIQSDGLTDLVQWDKHSLLINGQRVFLFTGEMHYWRIPVPELWRDILEKIKAAGFAGFTFYSSWGWHAFNSTTLDFETGAHDITKLYEIAKEVGLYFLLRPGPYINAEANAGGYPLWLTTGEYGPLRDNGSEYAAAYTPYIEKFSEISKPYLITNGGNGILYQIENEYGDQWTGDAADKNANPVAADYMTHLEKIVRESGIDVPTYFNNPNMQSKSWSTDYAPGYAGDTNLNGVDSYPSCWTCNVSACTGTNGAYVPYQVTLYHDYFTQLNKNMPAFLPEFQGGSFNPWGGPEGGCPNDLGADYANLFYRHNIAEGVTAVNLYMMYGGTNWGSFATPTVATSYDYSAPISEDRSIAAKYYETKLLALFTRAAKDLTQTMRVANSTSLTTNPAVLTTELRNPVTNAGFYVTIHATSSSATRETFKLQVDTSEGKFTIPRNGENVVLNGHQSKIITTDFNFGDAKLVYSTAEVLSYIVADGMPTVFLWVPEGEGAEFYIGGGVEADGDTKSGARVSKAEKGVIVNVAAVKGSHMFEFSKRGGRGYGSWGKKSEKVRVVVMDRPTAHLAWVPSLGNDPLAPANESVFVQGPYLVRSAALDGQVLRLTGDVNQTTTIEVYAPKQAHTICWNGKHLHTTSTSHGSITAHIAAPPKLTLPALKGWKSADSLPEKNPAYNASGPAWVVANHTNTTNPTKPLTYPVLYADEYGFHTGPILWRGTFSGHATGVKMSVQGGNAFGWSAWLNGVHVGSFLGDASSNTGNLTLSFSNATLSTISENVLLVLQDNTGHDETPTYLAPRGILGAALIGTASGFKEWKVAGNAGGDKIQLDPIRGPLAEGGLTAERLGWHLPDFNTTASPQNWSDTTPEAGFTGAGVRFHRTSVPLSISAGLDAGISFVLSAPDTGNKKFRAVLYVNGYQYGRYVPWIGNQVRFPVPPGVLDYSGDNVLGLAVWAQSEEGARVGVRWEVDWVTESSADVRSVGADLRTGWGIEREEYA